MKYTSKKELIAAIERHHGELVELIDSILAKRHKEPGVWGDDWTVHDLIAHVTAWEQLFLRWHREGTSGESPAMPAPGYKWNETPRLNRDLQAKFAKRSKVSVRRAFDASYEEILGLAQKMSTKQLLTPGHYAWTKKKPLASYLGMNTASHYRTCAKILKRWKKLVGLN